MQSKFISNLSGIIGFIMDWPIFLKGNNGGDITRRSLKSFVNPINPCFIFVDTDEYKEIFSAADQLGTLEFLRAVRTHQPGLVLVLFEKQVNVVLQFVQSHDYFWGI
jgi:hypothetical protein